MLSRSGQGSMNERAKFITSRQVPLEGVLLNSKPSPQVKVLCTNKAVPERCESIWRAGRNLGTNITPVKFKKE